MPVPLHHVLAVSVLLLTIGLAGVFTRRDAITVFLSIEIILNAANVAFVGFARALGHDFGHAAAFVVITVAAAEAAVGLGIVIRLSKMKEELDLESMRELKG